ncbi:phosphoribosylamine--glycine ligase [Clostridium fallax]|uniref:Phosphoribosylamine--glycine ligase n=1 Tax=Clostridium fallax TaxID=1533 RepID=A0A1M4W9K6_9CLOT|nr:phosphoribosylamine--glycine ligase [Clostridium fallax]SHE77916.1 phosphoribosylamine--glycine ligase [Clostridium fallax]SQB05938.1 phosphoribosylamine--glycine ligase [Clostridium fallax]
MKVLIIGSGGREHAIAWKLSKEDDIEKIYVSPGNGGTALENKCENISLNSNKDLIEFAKKEKIDFTIVGPEEPLINGIVDDFKSKGLKIFGPDKKGAALEGSKAYAKEFMEKYEIKTAKYKTFINLKEGLKYLEETEYPIVIKADGIAAGKGVIICRDKESGKDTLRDFMEKDIFKGAGKKVVIEEFLEGVEASILTVTDGKTIIPFISAKDHKQVYDGDRGPNTGGMGVICPNPYVTEEVMKEFKEKIMNPTLKGLKIENINFIGNIFFGIMITKKGVYLLEYNVRMGDPETEAILPLMRTNLSTIIINSLEENLENITIEWEKEASINVMLCSEGYPKSYKKGKIIEINPIDTGKIFISGAILKDNKLVTSGGRVLSLTVKNKNFNYAREECYENINKIKFNGVYFRKDIGKKVNN